MVEEMLEVRARTGWWLNGNPAVQDSTDRPFGLGFESPLRFLKLSDSEGYCKARARFTSLL